MSVLPAQTALQNGAYLLENVIGRGGFGITYRARDTQSERVVAIKECFPQGCARHGMSVVAEEFWANSHCEALKNRFRAQAENLKSIEDRHLARVLDCFDENDTVYLVMDLVSGPTLHDIGESRAISCEEALHWIEKVARALDALHRRGLLHLDVKPENIVLCDNEPVLLDFDLVQPLGESQLTTQPLFLALRCGTPGYAPLEQYARHAKLTPATDFYALGATFYYLLGGKEPAGAIERAAGEAMPFFEARGDVPTHWNAALRRVLELQSEARPQNAREFLLSLRELEEPDEEDEDVTTLLAPQLMTHGTGLHRVVLTTKTPIFPKRCVCCHDKSDGTKWQLVAASGRYEVPFCAACRKHMGMANMAGAVTFWGSISSFVLAIVVVVLSFLASSLWPLLLGPVCIVLNFAALSYGAIKSSRAEEMMKNRCCDVAVPATYNFNGQAHIWRFKNALYAADFRKRNADFVK